MVLTPLQVQLCLDKPGTSSRKKQNIMALLQSRLPILLACLLCMAVGTADAWGKIGHFTVCKIAEKFLSDETTSAVVELLPATYGGELAASCFWADEIKWKYKWSSPLHFINTPEVCNYDYDRDCHNPKGVKDMCIAGAVNNYTVQLQAGLSSGYNLSEALMFLSHFMGDIHMPLHVGFDDDDGGNSINIRWYKRKTNLHHLWDTLMIETIEKDFYNKDRDTMIEALLLNITEGEWSNELNNWEACPAKALLCPNTYASESIDYACKYAYKDVEQNITLGDDYFFTRYPILELRLAQAGIRLAKLLNGILGASPAFKIRTAPLWQEA